MELETEEITTEEIVDVVEEEEKTEPEKKTKFSFNLKGKSFYFYTKLLKKPIKIMLPKGSISDGAGSKITPMPPIRHGFELVDSYAIRKPYTYARIVNNTKEYEFVYEVIEPPLNKKEKDILSGIEDTLLRTLRYDWDIISLKDKEKYISESVNSFFESRNIKFNEIAKKRVMHYIVRNFVRYNIMDALIEDPMVEDVSCDGVEIPLYIYHKKYQSIKTSVVFEDENHLNSFVVYLGQRCGKQISVSDPILDGTSPEGHRVQATYGREITTRGATFTIRRYKEKPFTPTELIENNTASAEIVAYFWIAVEHGESMIIAGGPASGKTATLNALSLFIPPGAKIVSMEDTREVNLPHQNWIPGTTRTGAGEKGLAGKSAGEIDMYDLVRAALRQRPNYIIVGEVRGKETYTMFQAMATGHTTYSTMHADSLKSIVHRLENPPINCPRILMTALNDVIIQHQVRIKDDWVRRFKEVIEIVGFEPETNELILNVVFQWDQKKDKHIFKGHSYLFDKIMEMKNRTHDEMDQDFQRRIEVLKYLQKKRMFDYHDIWKMIIEYYRDPEVTVQKIREDLKEMEKNEEGGL